MHARMLCHMAAVRDFIVFIPLFWHREMGKERGIWMEKRKKLPVGIEGFKDFTSEGFYYVDKTGFIVDFLHNWGKVNLFTRPRRFGKSLNISMLQSFFEIGCDKRWFEGLKVSEEK